MTTGPSISLAAGDELPTLSVPRISRTTLALFAGASGDHEPLHLDHEYAQAAGMEDVFVHGLLVAAHVGRLLTRVVPQSHIRELRTRFVAVTPVNASLTCTGRVTARRHEQGIDVADLELAAKLPDETVVVRAWASVTVPDPKGA